MKTKYLIKFLNNSAHLDTDLEFVDIVKTSVHEGRLKESNSDYVFDFVEQGRHIKLAERANSDHSRKLAANHLQRVVRAAFLKEIYQASSLYFQDILKATMRKGLSSDQLIGEHEISLKSREILKLGSYEKITDKIATLIFRQLENEKNTRKLIEKINKKLGLNVKTETISSALPYLEIRHLLVHSEGKADELFCNNFPDIAAEEGKVIRLSHPLVVKAKEFVTALVKEFDEKIIELQLVYEEDTQP